MTESARDAAPGPVPFPELTAPIIAAPMAGVSTPALVAAVNAAGGLGFLAAGYQTPARLAQHLRDTRDHTAAPFGVNLFVPTQPRAAQDRARAAQAVAAYADRLAPEAARLDVTLPAPDWDDTDHWDAKVTLLADIDPVAIVSFTFGCPPAATVDRLHGAGSCVVVTVTNLEEARRARDAGADALVVQGFEAGGHRGTHRVDDEPNELDHLALLPMLAEVGLPMVAAGGITTAGDVRRAIAAGAFAVQVGTAFLRTDEAGTTAAYRMGLTDPQLESVITRAFSGRPARGLANRFARDHGAAAPAVFPQVDQLTKPLRAAAAAQGDLDVVSLWAGSGWRASREEPAGAVVTRLSS